METIKEITKDVLTLLRENKQLSTPENYFKEFKKQAHAKSIEIDEFKVFDEILETITDEEQKTFYEIESFNDLSLLLSRRVSNDEIKKLLYVFEDILMPSVNHSIKIETNDFLKDISNNPQKLFSRDCIKRLENLTEKRIDLDRLVLRKKSEDILKIISLISNQYDENLIKSNNSTDELSKINNLLKEVDISNYSQREIGVLQKKLIDSLFNVEKTMRKNNEELDKNRTKFKELNSTIEKLQKELEKVKKEKKKDFLTGILNKEAFDEEANKIEKKHSIFKTKYAMIFFDLDKFKNINEKHGHDCGDYILKSFANLLTEVTRREDVISRYGGEEFIALINYKNQDEIKKYVYRIKRIIEKNHFKYENKNIFLKFSAGVAFRDNYKSFHETKKHVDDLLYKAKETGKDKVLFDDGYELSTVLI